MTKRFRVTVNGQAYEVEVDELGGDSRGPLRPPRATTLPVPPAHLSPAPPPPAMAPAPAPAAAPGPGAAGEVTAPLPGTVAAVKVEPGQSVQAGQVLIVLEAMKMENEMLAPSAGTVKEIRVAKGASVAAGDVLVVLG